MIPAEPRVLVATASKHGATDEIGAEIGRVLEEAGISVAYKPAGDVATLAGWDGVVIGSAVYAGHWLEDALRLVEHHAEELEGTPVWIFSSGPIGDPPVPHEPPEDIPAAAEATGAREHRLFAGKLDPAELGFFERTVARLVGASEGDFRDLDDIRAWAREIAGTVTRTR